MEHQARYNTAMTALLSRKGSSSLTAALGRVTRETATALDVERVSVWRYDSARSAIRCDALFVRASGEHTEGTELRASDFPGYFAALESALTLAAHDAHTDLRTHEFSEVYLRPLGIGAMLDAPIHVDSAVVGVVCCEHVGPARTWRIDEQNFAGMMAGFTALAIETSQRRVVEQRLIALNERLEADVRGRTAELERQLERIAEQEQTLRSLSTPVLSVWSGVLVVPLIGAIDRQRGLQLQEQVLAEISRRRAAWLIVDVTGVGVLDPEAARALNDLMRATALLGARAVLVGLSPATAQTIVELGIQLDATRSLATLEQGLHFALSHLPRKTT